MGKRFVLEAEWSGYVASQQKISHREVLTSRRDKFEAIKSFRFTDGTTLRIYVRDAKPREKVRPILGYWSLIHNAVRQGFSGHSIDVMQVKT